MCQLDIAFLDGLENHLASDPLYVHILHLTAKSNQL
jgi:hypothetical protein